MIGSLIWLPVDLAICAALWLFGYLVVRSLVGRADFLAHLSLDLPVGGGLLSFGMFLISWVGVPLTAGSLVGLYFGLLLISGATAIWRSRGMTTAAPRASVAKRARPDWFHSAVWLVIGVLASAAFLISVGLSYYAWDDIATWAVGGYGIALEGTILAAGRWGNAGLLYPLNTQLQIAAFRMVDGDVLPGSKLLFPMFYLSLLVGSYRFLAQQGASRRVASAGILLLASVPVIALHATMGYNNLQFTLYLVLGILWILDGIQTRSTRFQTLGGLLLGVSIWTRPEGLPMAMAALGGMWVADRATRSMGIRPLEIIAPCAGIAVPWFVFRALHPVGTVEAYRDIPLALAGLLAGDVRWEAIWTIIRFIGGQTVRFRDWGFTLLVSAALVIWRLRPRDLRHDPAKSMLFMSSAAMGGVVFFAHYMVAYADKGEDFVYAWLALEFTRVFMPVGVVLVLLAVLAVRGRPDWQPLPGYGEGTPAAGTSMA
jgi:hypothetical protein